jgi:hypothetical protein
MPLVVWIILYLVGVVFWLWVIFWGGAEWLEGTLASGFLVSIFATRWRSEGIKLFAWLALLGNTTWFVLGIFIPEARL